MANREYISRSARARIERIIRNAILANQVAEAPNRPGLSEQGRAQRVADGVVADLLLEFKFVRRKP